MIHPPLRRRLLDSGEPDDVAASLAYLAASIVDTVADEHGIDPAEILTRTRREPVATARFEVAWILNRRFRFPHGLIGTILDRDRTTVLHGIHKIHDLAIRDVDTLERLDRYAEAMTP